jgi:ligand-binding sensor domain-containing protein
MYKFWQSNIVKGLLVFSLLVQAGMLKSQELINKVEYITTKEGLSSEGANAMLIDSYGVVWIGTNNGLNRLINNDVEVLHEYSKYGKLAGHSITALFEDSKGNIWVGDRLKGISIFVRKTKKWKTIEPEKAKHYEIINREVIEFVEDKKGNVWACFYPRFVVSFSGVDSIKSIYKFDSKEVHHDLEFFDGACLSEKGNILLSSVYSGIISFSPDTKKYAAYISNEDSIDLKKNDYGRVIKSYKNTGILTAINGNLYFVNKKKNKVKKVLTFPAKQESKVISVMYNGKILVAQAPYIWEIDENLKVTRFLKFDKKKATKNFKLVDIKKDRMGILWISTQKAILKIDPNKQHFTNIKDESLPNSYIRTLLIDSKHQLWVGSRYGTEISRFKLLATPNKTELVPLKSVLLKLANNTNISVNAFCETKKGALIATYSGLFLSTGKETKYLKDLNLSYPQVKQTWALFRLPKSDFLLGTRFNGFYRLSSDFKKLTPLKINISNGYKWNSINSVWHFTKDSEGNTWVLTSFGLYKVRNLSSHSIELYKEPKLNNYSVWAWAETQDKQKWVGTIDNGLFCFDSTGKLLKHVTMGNGLPSMVICALMPDRLGNIWASTPSSISKINIKTKKITNYGYYNGISVSGFNHRTVAKDKNGTIFFGSKKGITYFKPKDFLDAPYMEKSYLLVRKIGAKDISIKQPGEFEQGLILQPHQRNIKFEPVLVNYSNPQKNKYKYLLQGYDKTWTAIEGSAPVIQYTQLPPGKYYLLIKATNGYGISSANQLRIPIVVVAQFWETLWFKILIIIIGLAIVAYIIYLALNASYLQRKLAASEIASLRAQMNPHFFFNALNSIQDFIYHQDKKQATEYMSSFAKLLRIILNNSSKKFISLSEEVSFLELYLNLEALRFEGKLHPVIKVENGIDREGMRVPSMLLQPLVENAIKHGLTPKEDNLMLEIDFSVHKNRLKCIIKDNGVGRKKDKENKDGHISKGLSIVEERLLLINKVYKKGYSINIIDLKTQNGRAVGTEVIIWL